MKLIMLGICIVCFSYNNKIYAAHNSNLYINAEHLIIDREAEKAEYTGNVIVYFEDLTLRTTKLEIVFKIINGKRVISKIIIPTKLAVIRDKENELLLADSAQYFVNEERLVLINNVILQRRENILKTHKLVYYTKFQSIVKQ